MDVNDEKDRMRRKKVLRCMAVDDDDLVTWLMGCMTLWIRRKMR